MHEEGEEDRRGSESQSSIQTGQQQEQPCGPGEQSRVRKQADDAELGCDRQRRRVRAVALCGELCLRLVLARLRLAADPDPDHGMIREDDPRHPGEPRPATRRLARGVVHRGGGDKNRSCENEGDTADEQHAPQLRPSQQVRHRDADREERDEARLRIGEEQSRPEKGDERRPCPEADPAQPDRDEENGDRNHDVSAEDARILEERRDAEVRRVCVRARDITGKEVSVRQALEERNGREHSGERDERRRKRARSNCR